MSAQTSEDGECPIFAEDQPDPAPLSGSLDCSWALEEEMKRRPRPLEIGCQVGLGLVVIAVALFAAHAADAEHGLFYVLDALAAGLLLFILVLYCTGRLQPGRRWPNCSVFLICLLVWLLSLLLTFAAPSRRRKLLNLEEGSAVDEPCEEGLTALWIGLLLALVTVRVQMPSRIFAAFGLLISLQYLILGLILPRPECDVDRVPRGGPGGPLLGMAPIWTAALQLHALVLVLVAMQWRQDADRRIMALATDFVDKYHFRKQASKDTEADEQALRNCVERVVDDIGFEANLIMALCADVRRQSPPMTHAAWVDVVATICLSMSKMGKQLKSSSGGVNKADVNLFEAIKKSAQKDGKTNSKPSGLGNGQTLTGWIVESWTEQGAQLGPNMDKYATCSEDKSLDGEQAALAQVLDRSICESLNIGQWDFDALTVSKDHENIIEIVGFELLRPFVFLSRHPLQGFLRAVESMYQRKNPYHTNVHAADMTNSFQFVFKSSYWVSCDLPDAMNAATILAGLAHDVGHPGRNNAFMTSTRNSLAITYNDRSVLENFHAASLVRLLDESYGSQESGERSTLLAALPSDIVGNMRSLMTTLILKTDTQKHLEDLAAFRLRLGAEEYAPVSDLNDQQQAMCIMFRAADIGHSAKPWPMHEEWSKRVVREFHAQGDEEKRLGLKVSPLCEREGFVLSTAQCGFLQFICLPTWRELARFEQILLQKQQEDTTGYDALFEAVHSDKLCDVTPVVKTSSIPARGSERSAPVDGHFQPRRSCPSDGIKRNRFSIGSRLKRASAQTKVAPLGSLAGISRDGNKKMFGSSRVIAERCLAQCESNFQVWKSQAEADKKTKPAPPQPVKANRYRSESETSTSVTDVEAA